MSAFWQSLFFVAVAEMGDKSQLVALAFATRFKPLLVLTGIFIATLLVHFFSVLLGRFVDTLLPQQWIALAAGLAFIGFGVWTLRGDKLDEGSEKKFSRLGPLFIIAGTFFVAELGDKTMLATVTLAAKDTSFLGVWLGSTLGMVAADAVAIGVGVVVGKRLPERPVKLAAAAIFLVTGIYTIVQAWV